MLITCFGKNASASEIIISGCKALSRIVKTLNYYISAQQNIEDKETQNTAMEMYLNDEHKQFLDDYNHVISTHSNHLQQINEQLQTCQLSTCKIAQTHQRRHRRRDHQKQDDDGPQSKLRLYNNLLNNIHFWLYHQYDVGMRVKKDDHTDDDIKSEDEYFDHAFARIKKSINQKIKSSSTYNEDEIVQSNRYNMQIESNTNNHQRRNYTEKPFLDMFMDDLKEEHILQLVIDHFATYMDIQNYDTDALISDIIDYEKGSNIIENIDDVYFTAFINEYADDLNSMFCFNHIL